jgi:hypothetical protein
VQIGPSASPLVCRVAAALAVVLASCGLLASTVHAQAGEMKPMAVIAATSYDQLLTDIDYLGQFGGQVKAGQQLNNMLLMFTQNKGLEGLDKTTSWGAVVQTDGYQFVPVVCLPVTDLDALLQLAGMFQMTTSDVGDGITEIEIPNQSLYVKKDGNWAFLAQQAEMLATTPENPGELFGKLTADYDVAARVMVQNVPEMYRSIAIEQMRAGAQQGLEQQEGETDEAFAARKEMTEANIEQIVKAINELDELAIGFTADSENGGAHLDFIYSGLPGTQVAQSIEAYASAETKFAGCMRDGAAVRFNMSVTNPPELMAENKDQMKAQMDSLRQQLMNAIEQEAELPNEEARQTVKDAANELMDAVEATAMTGRMDMAGHVDMREGAISVVAGGFAKDTAKIESAFKKLAALVEEDAKFPGVNWNADSHGGAKIHTMSIPVPEEEAEARELLGETLDIALAIGSDVVYLSAGDGCVNSLKQAMDASAGSTESVKPMQFSMALTPILQTVAQAEPNPITDSMINALVTKSEGEDQVHMTAEAVDGKLRARLELEKGVLEAIGAAAQSARRQGAAAGF